MFTDNQPSPQSPDKVPERTNIKKWGIPAASIAVLLLVAGIIIFGNRVDIASALPEDFRSQMVRVERGSFMMGDPEENNLHKVTLKHDYYIGRTEVTQGLWRNVMGTNPSRWKGDNLPVESVSWTEAQEFCNRLNRMYAEKIPAGYRFDLPTEAQWEYAARGGNKSHGYEYSGSNDLEQVAWCLLDSMNISTSKTHPVGKKQANELGLYDMSGNVHEWCRDKYERDYPEDPEFLRRNGSSSGWGHVVKGGAHRVVSQAEIKWRGANRSEDKSDSVGFRLAFVFVPTEKLEKNNKLPERIQEDIARGIFFSDDGKTLLEFPTEIKSYDIPNGVNKIGDHAFGGCKDLENVTIPDSVKTIGREAFRDCSSLTHITIPDSVKTIDCEAFQNCTSLTHITIPDGVDEIKDSVFRFCKSLTDATIPNSVKAIGDEAFGNCTSLTHITIPSSVKTIESSAFSSCESLTSVTIPNGVKTIEQYTFSYCGSLAHITIPDSVDEIKENAFGLCVSLKSIVIPNKDVKIWEDAFDGAGCESQVKRDYSDRIIRKTNSR